MRFLTMLFLLTMTLTLSAQTTSAAIRYVWPNGGIDAGSCENSAAPCASAGYALGQATAADEIWIAGPFTESVQVSLGVEIIGKSEAGVPSTWSACSGVVGASACPRNQPPSGLPGFTLNPGSGATVEIRDLNITNTSGASGIVVDSGTLLLTDCDISNSVGPVSQGGAILVGFLGSAEVRGCSFASNDAFSGGAIFSSGSLLVEASSFSGNTSSLDGGAISATAPAISIDGSTFQGNISGRSGGALYLRAFSSPVVISSSFFTANSAVRRGGAISLNFTDFTITGGSILNNQVDLGSSVDEGGGGIAIGTGIGTISGIDISANTVGTGTSLRRKGGGISITEFSDVTISNSTLIGNFLNPATTDARGGGIYVERSTLNVVRCDILNNSAGGIYTERATLTMVDSTIDGHDVGLQDIAVTLSTIDVNRSTLSNNDVGLLAGAASTVNVSNSTIISDRIGVQTFFSSTVTLVSSTVVAPIDIFNQYALQAFQDSTINVSDSIVSGRCNIFPNAAVVPQFVAFFDQISCPGAPLPDLFLDSLADNGGATQTIKLLAGSPANNAGGLRCLNAPISGVDQRGVLRAQSGNDCDVGAYEVPEPGLASALAFGTIGLSLMARRRRPAPWNLNWSARETRCRDE